MKLKKALLLSVLAFGLTMGSTTFADNSGKWTETENKALVFIKNGVVQKNKWIKDNNKWYYVDSDGKKLVEQWIKINNKWYYLTEDGSMVENGFYYIKSDNQTSYFRNGVAVENEFLKLDGKRYYLQSNTYLKVNGWIKNKNGKWLFAGKDGVIIENGLHKLEYNGKLSYFKDGVALEKFWVKDNNKWYYIGSDAYVKVNEWIKYLDKWYYLSEDGTMVENGFYYIKNDKQTSYFRDGVAVENEILYIDGKKYYIQSNAYLIVNSWIKNENGKWLFAGKDGAIIKNGLHKLETNGRISYFNDEIAVENSWVKDNDKWYYIGADAYARVNEWIKNESGQWFYVDELGERVENKVLKINGKSYYFDKDGIQFYGQQIDFDGNRYFFNSNGEITHFEKLVDSSDVSDIKLIEVKSGEWKQNNGISYYIDGNGKMLKSIAAKISGKIYYFKSDGSLRISQWIEKNGKYYFIGTDGAVKTGFSSDDKGIMRYFSIVDGEMLTNIFAYDQKTETGYNIDKNGVAIKSNNPKEDFIKMVKPYVMKVVKGRGLFPSVAVAQIALETGYGRSTLGYPPVYNLFGIKAPDGAPESEYIAVWTTEYDSNNKPYDIIDKFKKFNGYEDAFNYYASLFTRNAWLTKWYKPVIDSKTAEEAANALTGRYATDPNYGKKLLQIIDMFNLKELDKEIYPNGVKP